MPETEAAQKETHSKKKSRVPMTLALVVGIAIVEGAGFYTVTKIFGGGPQIAHGAGTEEGHLLDGEEAGAAPVTVEVEVLKSFKVPNDRRGRLYVYDFDVALKVPGHREEEAGKLVSDRQREISDRIARVVRAADPAVLHEPELKTLRMQLQHAIGEAVGDQDLIVEVLIPRCVPIRSD
jgi:flagellar basal body-associated protein FliL